MATINLSIRSKESRKHLFALLKHQGCRYMVAYRRVYKSASLGQENQKIRNVIEIENRDEINSKLAKLKIHIIDEHNIAFMDGKIIDKQWIDNSISKC
jgi:hypothetical protein